ncbi:TraR/DksA C4-type zinc finger protein [Nonomuraea sp. NPDC005501]|uniref:TraR/DksA family transcriptional regulator n=1 Tax=Nonomuraea sp. NPDC005501 TaxID=3156884 RepID=UPI0033B27582
MEDTSARQRLQKMLADLDRSIGVLRGDRVAVNDRSPADAGSDLCDADRAQAMLTVAATQRRAVLDALKRLDDGTYGRCVDCAEPVPEGRLEARPEAARCVQCQGRRERRR